MFNDDNEDEDSGTNTVHYPCMPSLVALQQMRNRLQLASLGRKLMKWSALGTGKELRRLATDIRQFAYSTFHEDLQNALLLLARARYFYPNLNVMVLNHMENHASITLVTSEKSVSGVRVLEYAIQQTEIEPYPHLGIDKGGGVIQEAKTTWRNLLIGIITQLQLRSSFATVDFAFRSANKRKNVLTKVVIPRTKRTITYVVEELEEQQREEHTRMKMIATKKKLIRDRINKERAKAEEATKGICEKCDKCTNTKCPYITSGQEIDENLAKSMEPSLQQKNIEVTYLEKIPCLIKSCSKSNKKSLDEIRKIEVRIGSKEIIIKSSFVKDQINHEDSCPSCCHKINDPSAFVKVNKDYEDSCPSCQLNDLSNDDQNNQIVGLSSKTLNSQPSTSLKGTQSDSVSFILNVITNTLVSIIAYCKNVIISGFNLIDVGQLIILCEDALESIQNLCTSKRINDDTLKLKIDKAKICLHEIIKASSVFGKLVFKLGNSEKLIETYEVYEGKLLKCCKEMNAVVNYINVTSSVISSNDSNIRLRAIECKNHPMNPKVINVESLSSDTNNSCNKRCNDVQNNERKMCENNDDIKSRQSCTLTTCEKRSNKIQNEHEESDNKNVKSCSFEINNGTKKVKYTNKKEYEKNNDIKSRSSITNATCEKISNKVQDIEKNNYIASRSSDTHTGYKNKKEFEKNYDIKSRSSCTNATCEKRSNKVQDTEKNKNILSRSSDTHTRHKNINIVQNTDGKTLKGEVRNFNLETSKVLMPSLKLPTKKNLQSWKSEVKKSDEHTTQTTDLRKPCCVDKAAGELCITYIKSLLSKSDLLKEGDIDTKICESETKSSEIKCTKCCSNTDKTSKQNDTKQREEAPKICCMKSLLNPVNFSLERTLNTKTALNMAEENSKTLANTHNNCVESLSTTCHHSVITISTVGSQIVTNANFDSNNTMKSSATKCKCPVVACATSSKTVPTTTNDSNHNPKTKNNRNNAAVKALPTSCRHSVITISTLGSQTETNTNEDDIKSKSSKCNCPTSSTESLNTVKYTNNDATKYLRSTDNGSVDIASKFDAVTDPNKESILKLLEHLNVVLETTDLCRIDGLLSPSAEKFIESCQSMQSKLKSQMQDKLDRLKQNVVNLEKMASDLQLEINSPSLTDLLASCKEFGNKIDYYKQKRQNPELEKAITLLVKRLIDIVSLSRYSDTVGLVPHSIKSFITSAEQLKQLIESKSHETTSQCAETCMLSKKMEKSQKSHDNTRQQKICCGTNKTGNLPKSRSVVIKDTEEPDFCKEVDAEVEINQTNVQPTCDSKPKRLVQIGPLNVVIDGNPQKSKEPLLIIYKKEICDTCRENQNEAVTDKSSIDDINEHTITRVIRRKNENGSLTEELQKVTLAKTKNQDRNDGCKHEDDPLPYESGEEDSKAIQIADQPKYVLRITQSYLNTHVPPLCKPPVRLCISLDSNVFKVEAHSKDEKSE